MLLFASVCKAAERACALEPGGGRSAGRRPVLRRRTRQRAQNVAGDAPHIKIVYAYASDMASHSALVRHCDPALHQGRGGQGGAHLRQDPAPGPWIELRRTPTSTFRTVALEHPVAFYARARSCPTSRVVCPTVPVSTTWSSSTSRCRCWAPPRAAGQADDSPWATNVANVSAHSRYAYRRRRRRLLRSEQLASQYADQVLHEVLHTLGAVQPSAPHFSGGAHCYQLFDVMCYTPKDGTVRRSCATATSAARPRTPASRWTAGAMTTSTHRRHRAPTWPRTRNPYDSGFLCTLRAVTGRPSRSAARLAVVAGDGQSVTVSAASSADPDGAVVSYVWDLDGDGVYDTAGPAAQTVAVAGRDAQRLTVAAVDNDNLVATATITVDEHSVPGQAGAAAPAAIPWVAATRPERSATPLPCRPRAWTLPRIAVAGQPRTRRPCQVAGSPSARRTTLKQVRERGAPGHSWPHRVTFMSVSRCAAAPVSWRAAGSPPRGARGASRCA